MFTDNQNKNLKLCFESLSICSLTNNITDFFKSLFLLRCSFLVRTILMLTAQDKTSAASHQA